MRTLLGRADGKGVDCCAQSLFVILELVLFRHCCEDVELCVCVCVCVCERERERERERESVCERVFVCVCVRALVYYRKMQYSSKM